MKNTQKKEMRCQNLLILSNLEGIKDYYDALQKDYAMIMRLLIGWSGVGHLIWDADGIKYKVVTPESSKFLSDSLSPFLGQLISIIGKGGNPATNCYGLFYEPYKKMTKVRKDNIVKRLFDSLANVNDEDFDKNVKFACKKYNNISKKDWDVYRERVLKGESVDLIWKEIELLVINGNDATCLVELIRKLNIFPKVSGSNSCGYCTALMDMVVSSFGSWIKCAEEHQNKRKVLQAKIDAVPCQSVLKALCELGNAFDELNYGLSGKVLFKSINLIKKNKNDEYFALSCAELRKEKYKVILEADEKTLNIAYNGWKNFDKLQRMKLYTSMPKFVNDYQVSFGLTGKGLPFVLQSNNGQLSVTIDKETFICQRSFYFNDLSVQLSRSTSTSFYKMRFRNRLKDKKKESYKNWIDAELREIKLQKKSNGKYYLALPYAILNPKEIYSIERFFNSSSPDNELVDSMPNSLIVSGFDINLSTPLTMTKAKINKNDKTGPISALDYGTGQLIDQPKIVAADTPLSDKIRKLSRNCKEMIGIIRQHKKANKIGVSIEEESQKYLDEQSKLVGKTRRLQIQTVVSKINDEASQLRNAARKNGHNNLSESIRLLELLDVLNSLKNSYYNIHVLNSQKSITLSKKNDARANFRDFVSKQYAALIVSASGDSQVIFIEDIEIDFDSDNDSNSISRLFAPGQLKQAIENACHKAGKSCVFVNPALTSRTDPVTGILGKRGDTLFAKGKKIFVNKDHLYVKRNGVIGIINSDIAASFNVLLVGLNHSVFPRRFFVDQKGNIQTYTASGEPKKRLQRFLSERRIKKNLPFVNTFVYVTPDGCISETQKIENEKAMESEIMHLNLNKVQIQNFDLNPTLGNSYKAFRVQHDT
jgi:hypothetical protein